MTQPYDIVASTLNILNIGLLESLQQPAVLFNFLNFIIFLMSPTRVIS